VGRWCEFSEVVLNEWIWLSLYVLPISAVRSGREVTARAHRG